MGFLERGRAWVFKFLNLAPSVGAGHRPSTDQNRPELPDDPVPGMEVHWLGDSDLDDELELAWFGDGRFHGATRLRRCGRALSHLPAWRREGEKAHRLPHWRRGNPRRRACAAR